MRIAVLSALATCLAISASATLVPRVSLEEMTKESGVILEGRVVRHWTAWDASHRFIWTHYAVEVKDVLKGVPGREFTVSEPGGTLDGMTMDISDVVRFSDQEDVVLFLHQTPIGYWRTYGWAQGKFSVRTSAADARQRVYSNAAGMALVTMPKGGGAAQTAQMKPASPVESVNGSSLAEFKSKVRSLVATQAAAQK